ncbi:hypothetical protein SDD30_01595 [Moorella naiadis]|uniref:hypothetical protein n=1 Tax=Moorella naiadis (nom. illeg.) TaxID=3093670 RepID=UPI003D9C9736
MDAFYGGIGDDKILTERDHQVLRFLAESRFCTPDQLIKAGIFKCSRKRCLNRLIDLKKDGFLKSGRLSQGQAYYFLTPAGGEAIELPDPWYSRRYRNARENKVVRELIYTDFAITMEVKYLDRKDIFDCLNGAGYEALNKIFKAQDRDRYFKINEVLHALILDYYYSLKSLAARVSAYTKLPHELRDKVVINILTFSLSRKAQLARLITKYPINVKIYKADLKY